jgi:FAD/FMN-containing dehydrogenase
LFPLDLGARGTCTIGGNLSTNAGGNSVIRYGMAREQVLGIEAVLADGTIISSLNSVMKNNTGYDLKQLFIGSEGTLGIITRAVLRLRPLPRSRQTALVGIADFDRVARFLPMMDAALGGTLSAFELMWNDFYSLIVADGATHGYPLDTSHPFYVLIEASGSQEDIDRARFERALEEAFQHNLVADAAVAQSRQQRAELWAIRDDIDNLFAAMHPMITFDVSLSIAHMDEYIRTVRTRLLQQWPQGKMVVFGHMGDGNLHLCVSVASDDAAIVHAVDEVVYSALAPYQGVISAEHGIGIFKRDFLPISRNATEIALMQTLKETLDPKGILNPGKIFLPRTSLRGARAHS